MLGHMVYFQGTNSRWESGEMLDEVFCSPCFVSHVDYVAVKCRSNCQIWIFDFKEDSETWFPCRT